MQCILHYIRTICITQCESCEYWCILDEGDVINHACLLLLGQQ